MRDRVIAPRTLTRRYRNDATRRPVDKVASDKTREGSHPRNESTPNRSWKKYRVCFLPAILDFQRPFDKTFSRYIVLNGGPFNFEADLFSVIFT